MDFVRHATLLFCAMSVNVQGNGAEGRWILCMSKDAKKKEDELPRISVEDLCKELETRGKRHNHGYYHYTLWKYFALMAKGVKTPDSDKERKFIRLSLSKLMNDKYDRRMKDGTYLMSFSIGDEENVATWIIYGRDVEGGGCKNEKDLCALKMDQAIRLKFRMKTLNKWVNEFNKGMYKVYVPDKDNKDRLMPVQQDLKIRARLLDVAYVGSNCSSLSNRACAPCVKLGKQEYKILDWPSDRYVDVEYAPFFKFKGWEYERETRLVVEVDGKKLFPDYIFIPFDGPIESLIEEAVSNTKGKYSVSPITMGPWFEEKGKYDEIKGLDVCKNTSNSFYLNQIDLNTRKSKGK